MGGDHVPQHAAAPDDAIVFVGCALLGVAIERIVLRPLQGKARIAPLLATIGLSFVLDQLVQLVCSPDPRAVPTGLPDWRVTIGGVTIGPIDFLIAGVGLVERGAALPLPAIHASFGSRCARPPRIATRRCRWA